MVLQYPLLFVLVLDSCSSHQLFDTFTDSVLDSVEYLVNLSKGWERTLFEKLTTSHDNSTYPFWLHTDFIYTRKTLYCQRVNLLLIVLRWIIVVTCTILNGSKQFLVFDEEEPGEIFPLLIQEIVQAVSNFTELESQLFYFIKVVGDWSHDLVTVLALRCRFHQQFHTFICCLE